MIQNIFDCSKQAQNQEKTDYLPVHRVQESHWPPKEN